MIDFACATSTIFFACSNLMYIILRVTGQRSSSLFDPDLWKELDPFFLKFQWERRMSNGAITGAAGLLSAVAWFLFCIPVINVAWILSHGGKRRVGMHVLIGALAVGGSIAELMARLMMVGVTNVSHWLAKDFNLDHWLGEETNDGTGWKVLEMGYLLSHGIILWIDAFEWLALCGVLVLIFYSVRTDEGRCAFGRKWSMLGLAIGILCLFDFVAEVLRLESWGTFMIVSIVISVINTLILMPIWLVMLGRQLPFARKEYENSETEAFFGNRDGHSNGDTIEVSNEEAAKVAIEGEMS